MSNEIRRNTKIRKGNPNNDIKLIFCVIISLWFIFVYTKNLKKKTNLKKNLISFCADLRYHKGMTTFRSILGSIRADSKIKVMQEHEDYLNKL